jgi:hypothetical protein
MKMQDQKDINQDDFFKKFEKYKKCLSEGTDNETCLNTASLKEEWIPKIKAKKYETDWEGKYLLDRKGNKIEKGKATFWQKFGIGNSS